MSGGGGCIKHGGSEWLIHSYGNVIFLICTTKDPHAGKLPYPWKNRWVGNSIQQMLLPKWCHERNVRSVISVALPPPLKANIQDFCTLRWANAVESELVAMNSRIWNPVSEEMESCWDHCGKVLSDQVWPGPFILHEKNKKKPTNTWPLCNTVTLQHGYRGKWYLPWMDAMATAQLFVT